MDVICGSSKVHSCPIYPYTLPLHGIIRWARSRWVRNLWSGHDVTKGQCCLSLKRPVMVLLKAQMARLFVRESTVSATLPDVTVDIGLFLASSPLNGRWRPAKRPLLCYTYRRHWVHACTHMFANSLNIHSFRLNAAGPKVLHLKSTAQNTV